MKRTTIDAVIQVYKPPKEFKKLIRILELQKIKIRNIYLMHTEDGTDLTRLDFLKKYDNIIIKEIKLGEFDHGGTRDAAFRLSDAEYVLCMTQDAVPMDASLTEKLLDGMKDEKVAVAYARQLPKKECNLTERFIRSFNYPKESVLKTKADLGTLGVKTYFCSNVCALYRRDIYIEQGGFEKRIIISEDMMYAASCIHNGYKILYAASAEVLHSHNYTNKEQFHRNFDIGVSQAQHAEIFFGIKSESEGIRMIKRAIVYMIKNGHLLAVIELFTSSMAKYLGYFLGKNYRQLPKKMILCCTMNPQYWNRS